MSWAKSEFADKVWTVFEKYVPRANRPETAQLFLKALAEEDFEVPDECAFVEKYLDAVEQADGAVLWSSCGIDWGLTGDPVLSAKDAAAPALADFDSPFVWEGAP